MSCRREAFTVRVQRSGSAAPAGVGFVVDATHIVTCAHVVNTALGRDQRAQEHPGPMARIQVDFPMLGDAAGAPSRSCAVQAWVPPPASGVSGGDVAGLVVVGEGLPGQAGPAVLADPAPLRDVAAGVFGFPGNPPRQVNGAWAELRLRGAVGGGIIQLDAASESAIRAQPGYSGSPVVMTGAAGDDTVLGMLAIAGAASGGGPGGGGDVYAIPLPQLARAWPDVIGRRTVAACPYRGLGAFTADDADVFTGRDAEVGRLAGLARTQPLVVVTGPSGVGKSSLINAGLIPRLRNEGWAAGSFRPGGLPVDGLARAIAAVQTAGRPPALTEVGELAALLRSEGLTRLGSRVALTLGRPVLLHADQLEEILDPAGCPPDLRAEFLELLLSARPAPGDGLHVVATLRADFWTQLLEHPDAGARLEGRWFGLSPMSGDRLESVIAEPARARGVRYQDGLVKVIAADAGGGYGLPLLEFALTQLWPHQLDRRITLAAYQDIGGVAGALSRHAEQIYQEMLGRFAGERIRRVVLALVRSRGGAAEATRRVVPRERLGQDWEVVQALAGQRLLTIGRDPARGAETAEIAHEALIREWPTFAGWVNDDADFQHWLLSAEERAADGELLPDTRLAEADRWLAERIMDIPPEVRQLIQDSKSQWLRRVTELQNARNRAEARRLAAAAELALGTPRTSQQVPIALAVESLRMSLGMEPVLEADIAARHAIRTAARQVSRLDHDSPGSALAFSPEGTRLAAGSADGGVRVFDLATGDELARLDHDDAVSALAFSPDGTRLAAGSADGGVRVFDLATGDELARLDHDRVVHTVAFSPDGTRLAAGGYGGARVFGTATGDELARLDRDDIVNAVAYSPDGTRLAVGSADSLRGRARIFDAVTGAELARLSHHDAVHAVAFSPDGARIATGSGYPLVGGSARVFDPATGAELARLDHDDVVHAVAYSPDGTLVATGSDDNSARVFDPATGAELARLDHESTVYAVAFSSDGTRVASGSIDGSARVFDANIGAGLARLDHGGSVNAVVFSPDGTRLATGSDDENARVFDPATGTELVRLGHPERVHAVAFSPDGTRLATGCYEGGARVFDVITGGELAQLDPDNIVSAVGFSPDGTRLATGSGDGGARVFDVVTGAELACQVLASGVSAVAFSPDGTRLAAGSYVGGVRVFDTATGAELARLDHDDAVYAVAFSPDGTRLATASGDPSIQGSARVVDAVTWAELARLDHDDAVYAVAFSPDGTRLATGSGNPAVRGRGSARVFDAAAGAELARLDHDGPVFAVAFSPDGALIATGSMDGSVWVWCTGPGQLLEQAAGRLTRNLTEKEWKRYFGDEPYRKTRPDLP